MRRTNTSVRRFRRALAVVLFSSGLLLTLLPSLAAAEDPRLDTPLIGYDNEAIAQAVSVRFFEPFIPLPVDPGEPQFELTLAHTAATLTTGPLSRGLASSIWPGAGVGDGWGTVVCSFGGAEDCDDTQPFPIRASAEYPGSGPDAWTETTELAPGVGMFASALGLDAYGQATHAGAGSAADALVRVGNVESFSEVTEVDGATVSRARSTLEGIDIAGGIITIESLSTMVEAVSDGETSSTSGQTVVAGLTVGGQPARLTDDGIEIVSSEDDDGEVSGPLDPLTDPVFDAVSGLADIFAGQTLEDAIGISLLLPAQEEMIDGTIAERSANGLTIVLDTDVLNSALLTILEAANYRDLLNNVPEDLGVLTGYFVELANFAPRTEIVLGRSFVAASAVPPFVYEPPALPDLPPLTTVPPPAVDIGGVTAPTGGNSFTSPPAISTGPTSPSLPGSPSVAPPATTQPAVVAAAIPVERNGGVPLVLVGLALILAAIPSWGMSTLREAAVGPGAATSGGGDIPDLRKA